MAAAWLARWPTTKHVTDVAQDMEVAMNLSGVSFQVSLDCVATDEPVALDTSVVQVTVQSSEESDVHVAGVDRMVQVMPLLRVLRKVTWCRAEVVAT